MDLISKQLAEISPAGFYGCVELSKVSHYKTGGKAKYYVEPKSIDEVKRIKCFSIEKELKICILGETTNVIFPDQIVDAIFLKIGPALSGFEVRGNIFHANAGIWVPCLARRVMNAGFGGSEHLIGIPGTLGGLITMNGGSNRQSISDAILEVEMLNSEGKIEIIPKSECGFGYRESIFQKNRSIILSAKFKFDIEASKKSTRKKMLNILQERRNKFPRKEINCGSVFKSDPSLYQKYGPPGKIIENLGLKGLRVGGAVVSYKHANFINNSGNAKSSDIISLIKIIQEKVRLETGYRLETEVKMLIDDGRFVSF